MQKYTVTRSGVRRASARHAPPPVAAGFRPAAAAMAVAAAFSLSPLVLHAQPTGGQAIHGQASFQRNGNHLLVTTQNGPGTSHSAINWQSFSVPGGSTTQFLQPSAASTSINRVLGSNPSAIFGTLSSNGKLVLVNPAGITVGQGAVVDTAGFTASTLRMADADALAGRLSFGNGGAGPLQVDGQVVARGGDIVLIAPQVATGAEAVVRSEGGATVLAAGQKVEVTGRGLEGIRMELQAGGQALNLGKLQGDAVGLFAGTLRHSGLIQAQAATEHGGRVVLQAARAAQVDGKIAASRGQTGGQVAVTAQDVTLGGTSAIEASGAQGGGEVLIGGGWQGKDGRVANAVTVRMEDGASIRADATHRGDGGTVVLWSDETTSFGGRITARGGIEGGDGGQVETSGKRYLVVNGKVDTVAPRGRVGRWLLDPAEVEIVGGTAPVPAPAPLGPTLLYEADLEAAASDVTIMAQDKVTVSGTFVNNDIALQPNRSITIDAYGATGIIDLWVPGGGPVPIELKTSGTGNITLTAGMGILPGALTTQGGSVNVYSASGPIQINAPITSNGGAISIGSAGGQVEVTSTTISSTSADITLSGVSTVPAPSSAAGLFIDSSNINAGTGSLFLNGDSAGYDGVGVIFSTLTGNGITVTGTGDPAGGATAGIYMQSATVQGAGNVSLDGGSTTVWVGDSLVESSSGGIQINGGNLTHSQSGAILENTSVHAPAGAVEVHGRTGGVETSAVDIVWWGGGGATVSGQNVTITGTHGSGSGDAIRIDGDTISATQSMSLLGSGGNVSLYYANINSGSDMTINATGGGIRVGNYTSILNTGTGILMTATTADPVAVEIDTYAGINASSGVLDIRGTVNTVISGSARGIQQLGSIYGGTVLLTGAVTSSDSGSAVKGIYVDGDVSAGAGGMLWKGTTNSHANADSRDILVPCNCALLASVGDAVFEADRMELARPLSVSGPNAAAIFRPATAGRPVAFGGMDSQGSYPGSLYIPQNTLLDINAPRVEIGAATAGALTQAGSAQGSQFSTLTLLSGTAIQQSPGATLSMPNVQAQAPTVSLNEATNAINTVAGSATSLFEVSSTAVGGLTVGDVGTSSGIGLAAGTARLVADNMMISASVSANRIEIEPLSLPRPVSLGGGAAAAPTSLNLEASDLANLSATTLVLGHGAVPTIQLYGPLSVSGGLKLVAAGPITQDLGSSLVAPQVTAIGESVALGASGNAVQTISGTATGGDFVFQNGSAGTLTIGTVDGVSGITANMGQGPGSVAVIHNGPLVLAAPLSAQASGDAVQLVGKSLDNQVGSGAIALTGGPARWLVFLPTPTGNNFNGLDSGNEAVWGQAFTPPGALPTGNRYVFEHQPQATITADPITREYDGTATFAAPTGTLALDIDFSTYAGVFLPDPAVTYALEVVAPDKIVGTYSIGLAAGSVTQPTGYAPVALISAAAAITPMSLTLGGITADNKVYDDTTAASFSGTPTALTPVAGDIVTVGGVAAGSFADAHVGTAKPVTMAGLTLGGKDSANYSLVTGSYTADITPKPLTVTAQTDSRAYNATTVSTLAPVVTGLAGDDTLTSSSQAFDSKNAGVRTLVPTAVVADGNGGSNYTISPVSAAGSITPAALTVTAQAHTRVYDGTAISTLLPVVTGLQGSDTVATSSQLFDGRNAGARTLAPVVTLNDGNGGANYAVNAVTATGSITPAPLTISAQTQSRAYDATVTSSLAPLVTGLKPGDTTSGLSQVFDSANAGARTLTPSGTVGDGNGGANYLVSLAPAGGTITPKALSVTAQADSRVYDGTTRSSGTPIVSGLVGSDTVRAASQAFADKNAGSGKALVPTVSISDGNGGANYVLNVVGSNNGTITPALLTAGGLSANSKAYDATTAATLSGTVTLSGVLAGDTVGAGAATGVFSDKNVGVGKPVTVSAITLTGTDAGNYNVTPITGLSASITPASLTATGLAALDRVYDGTTIASLSGGLVLSGLFAGDAVSASGGTGSFADKNVGTGKSVSVSGLALAGADAANYILLAPSTLTASITPKPLSVTGLSAQGKVYDASTSAALAGSAALSGVVAGDAVNVSGGTGSFLDKNVGTAKAVTVSGLLLSGADAPNYSVTPPLGLTADITRRNLLANGLTVLGKVYDGTTAATVAGTLSLSGVLSGDTVTAFGGTGAFLDKNAGVAKPVVLSGVTLAGADAGNYQMAPLGNLAADIAPAPLTFSGLTAASKVYDATVAATLSGTGALGGVLPGDSVTAAAPTASFDNKNVGTNKTVTLGNVSLTGPDATNYTLTAPATLVASITPAPLVATGLTAADKVYDGTTAATLLGTATLSGAFAGDSVSLLSGGASFLDKNVGDAKPVTLSGIALSGADAGNYTLVAPAGLAASITPKPLSVLGLVANDKVYDATTVASLGGSLTLGGLVPGDVVAATTGAASFVDKNAGTAKPVTVAGVTLTGTDARNYTVTPPAGLAANITPAPLTVTANNREKVEGDTTIFTGTEFTATGLVGGEQLTNVTLASQGAPSAAAQGRYDIIANTVAGTAGFDPANYQVSYNFGSLLVTASAPGEVPRQIESLVVQFAQLFVQEAKAQEEKKKEEDKKNGNTGGVTVTDTACSNG